MLKRTVIPRLVHKVSTVQQRLYYFPFISVSVLYYQSSCHNCIHIATIFGSQNSAAALEADKTARRRIRAVSGMFQHSCVKKKYSHVRWNYFLTKPLTTEILRTNEVKAWLVLNHPGRPRPHPEPLSHNINTKKSHLICNSSLNSSLLCVTRHSYFCNTL
jgi:hypothetical protein